MKAQTRLIFISLAIFLGTACAPSGPAPLPYFFNNDDEEDTTQTDILADVAAVEDVLEPISDAEETTDILENDVLLEDTEVPSDVLADITEDASEPEEDTTEPSKV